MKLRRIIPLFFSVVLIFGIIFFPLEIRPPKFYSSQTELEEVFYNSAGKNIPTSSALSTLQNEPSDTFGSIFSINSSRPLLKVNNYVGQFCNVMLTSLDAVMFAQQHGYNVLITDPKVRSYFKYVDLDLLQQVSGVEILLLENDPPNISKIDFDGRSKMHCAFKTTNDLVKRGFRPNLEEKRYAEERFSALKSKGKSSSVPTVSIHLRRMTCTKEFKVLESHYNWFREWAICHESQNTKFDVLAELPHFCSEALDQRFIDSLKEFPQFNTSSFTLFVASDIGNDGTEEINQRYKILDASFFDLTKTRKFGVEHTIITKPGDSMISDMWLCTLTDVHKGNTHSTCDTIIAMWRAELRNGSNFMIPKACFSNYQFSSSRHHC